ncbi:uncharacterized protein [Eurosta solidaginis]|uniref:uncharacterized protein isoform X2 n=1 Tax=Eurosta solidaginis TaxID=178769 RepID=UPI0035311E78
MSGKNKKTVDGMQEVVSDDFDLLHGTNSIYEKGMCLAVNRMSPHTSPVLPVDQNHNHLSFNDTATEASSNLVNDIKGVHPSTSDLFPTHPTTWQQHPMNSQEHAHYRLQKEQQQHNQNRQNERHQNRLNFITSKLLLRSSDDPLICRGANSVGTVDDDHPLIISTSQSTENNSNNQMHKNQSTIKTACGSSNVNYKKPTSATTTSIQLAKKVPQKGCSSLTKQQLKVKAGLISAQNRAAKEHRKTVQQTAPLVDEYKKNSDAKHVKKKGVIKLRFHHQALPSEYLSHYEAKQTQPAQRVKETKSKSTEMNASKVFQTPKLPPPKSAHENVRSWLKKIAAIHRSAQDTESRQRKDEVPDNERKSIQNDKNNNYEICRMLESKGGPSMPPCNSITSNTIKSVVHKFEINSGAQQSHPRNPNVLSTSAINNGNQAPLKRIINYADLPYMGEITLDNTKPRRGRKPKKADICRLIYKNYGTIFPGTPENALTATTTARTELQHGVESFQTFNDLPLNLCMRDQQSDYLSLSSEENVGETSDDNSNSKNLNAIINAAVEEVETPMASKFSPSLPISNNKETEIKLEVEPDEPFKNSTSTLQNADETIQVNSKDMLMHPVSLYYQKLLSGSLVSQNSQPFGLPVETIEKDNQLTLKIPIPNGLFRIPKRENVSPILNADHQVVDYPDLRSTPSSIKSEMSSTTSTPTSSTTVSTPLTQNQQMVPQKRKRSAIFIPPIPAENTTNPTTEVSICKFKFTGGAKPTLQEKKMLSVDSGGNYRYYSGTGDKSTRGYEYFPRESLQNSAGFLPGVNCTPNYMHHPRECAPNDIPPPSAELSNEFLQIPESPSGALLLPDHSSPSPISGTRSSYSGSPALSAQQNMQNLQTILSSDCKNDMATRSTASSLNSITEHSNTSNNFLQRKKKTRRSSQREKLERTFKEKGFLIQTQQLESAEGATYCKFRQLKKFTRYLFRNWKDYLPEEVNQTNKDEALKQHQYRHAKDATKAEDNEQLTIESILERHGFLSTGRVCAENSNRPSSTSSTAEKFITDQQTMDNIEKT